MIWDLQKYGDNTAILDEYGVSLTWLRRGGVSGMLWAGAVWFSSCAGMRRAHWLDIRG